MSDYKTFIDAVKDRAALLQKQNNLYDVTITKEELYDHYLSSFPTGTNKIFRTAREYECNACRAFITNFGSMVYISKDLNVQTVWDVKDLAPEYQTVVDAMRELVLSKSIAGIFRRTQANFGQYKSSVALEDGTTRQFYHLHAIVEQKFVTLEGEAQGAYNTSVEMLKTAFTTLSDNALNTVIDLAVEKQIYRGEEHLPKLRGFLAAFNKYHLMDAKQKDLFIAVTAHDMAISRFKNTVIGVLVTDIATEALDLEAAVRKYEMMVAPANYQRTSQVITQRQVDEAVKFLETNNISIERRMANIGDIAVNNVKWVSAAAQQKMKSSVASLLSSAVTQKPVVVGANTVDIGIEDFINGVMPGAKTMRMLVEPKLAGNFVTLTTSEDVDAKPLFKWDNNFAWAYDGNLADSDIRKKVQERGGRVDGVLRFTHSWNYDKRNASLMDLHVFMPGSSAHVDGQHDKYPSGQRVGWNNRNDRISGGVQDVDYVTPAPEGYVPVENITFPTMDKLKNGTYVFKVHNWQHRMPTQGGFRAEIEFGGELFQYEYSQPLKNKEWVTVAEATLANGVFSIEHKLPITPVVGTKWGVDYGQYAEISTMMLSPNYWDGNAVGNKHYIFILKDAKTDEQPRGIFNEYLNGEMSKHRKVFDVLGSKARPELVDNQLSGIGISSTISKTVTIEVTTDNNSKRIYNVSV